MKRGSMSIEFSVVISLVLVVICALLLKMNDFSGSVLSHTQDVALYQEAFYKKIDALLLEKVHREWR